MRAKSEACSRRDISSIRQRIWSNGLQEIEGVSECIGDRALCADLVNDFVCLLIQPEIVQLQEEIFNLVGLVKRVKQLEILHVKELDDLLDAFALCRRFVWKIIAKDVFDLDCGYANLICALILWSVTL